MRTKKILLSLVLAVFAFGNVIAQEQYLHLYKDGARDKSYRVASIDSAVFDTSSSEVYLDLYRSGRKYRAGNVAELDSFKVGDELLVEGNDEEFSAIDLDNGVSGETTDIFTNLRYDDMVMVEGGTFTMGATSEQGSYYYNNELPTH